MGGKEKREKRKKKSSTKRRGRSQNGLHASPNAGFYRRGALYNDMGRLLRVMSQLQ